MASPWRRRRRFVPPGIIIDGPVFLRRAFEPMLLMEIERLLSIRREQVVGRRKRWRALDAPHARTRAIQCNDPAVCAVRFRGRFGRFNESAVARPHMRAFFCKDFAVCFPSCGGENT